MTRQDYELNTLMIEEEYQLETNHLTEAIMGVIDDCRKSIKDDRDDADAIDIHSIFQDAYARLKQKRSLRKRTAMHHHSDHRGSPARLESRGRRQKNTPAPHNIHAPLSTKEEDEVENDFLQMKGISPKRNGNPSRR
ncbi:hypothetical protein DM01DRAFT_1202294 [Hesseltinella vesiculosa]|uniref:Uncharacterized protein n=1 Tax=Hesseltinella vesiculosa TaxID=101127 RepID=A0A1X2G2X7_9FUNG|nr:hypothetical protein DM01DRAFT_1202294 [Hesseltinella vesiculosa]